MPRDRKNGSNCSRVAVQLPFTVVLALPVSGMDFSINLTNILVFSKIANMNAIYKALADPTRRKILELLRDRDLSAGEIAAHFNLAKPTLSGHFAILKAADLIQADKVGTTITYRLNISVLEEALLSLMNTFNLPHPRSVSTSEVSHESEASIDPQ
jgi:ArsR family transcriptional regulator, arsenate/arsenite/antimonite-responsive transcriptional repressor